MNGQRLLRYAMFLILLSLILLSLFYLRDHVTIELLQAKLLQFGIWAPLAFILFYAIGVVLFFPGSVLTLAGGFLFGPVWGTVYNMTGASLGATLAFLIARYIAHDWVAARVGTKLAPLMRGIERDGWRYVMVLRLVPLFPFTVLNFALGLTPVRLLSYVWASAVFMLPGAFAYTYVGSLGQTALAGELKTIVTRSLIALGLLILLAAIPWFMKRLRHDTLD